MLRLIVSLILFIGLSLSSPAFSHDIDFGFLEIKEQGEGQYSFLFRYSSRKFDLTNIQPVLPEHCQFDGYLRKGYQKFESTMRWQASCSNQDSEALSWLSLDGLPGKQRVLVRYSQLGGMVSEKFLNETHIDIDDLLLKPSEETSQIQWQQYFVLGFEHILEGYDHLAVVLCFLLLFHSFKTFIWTVTGFTVGHTLSLITVSLNVFQLPMVPVEACIALSIVFLCREIFVSSFTEEKSYLQKAPFIMAAAIGLLHGLGFASALNEIGLPAVQNILAILVFNLGIEIGQLAFLAVCFLVLYPVKKFNTVYLYSKTSIATSLGSLAFMIFIQRLWA